jgi:hypothetical protein
MRRRRKRRRKKRRKGEEEGGGGEGREEEEEEGKGGRGEEGEKGGEEVLSDRAQNTFWHSGRIEGLLEPSRGYISAIGSTVPTNGSLFK